MSRWEPNADVRLASAAISLFREQGYEATTVAEIAEAAGLTKRTFFRHFADKREVLFGGSEEFERAWVEGVAAAPAGAAPLIAVRAGLSSVASTVDGRHAFARSRARIIAANPELQERELMKLEQVTGAVARALEARGISESTAALAAQVGVGVFHVAFGRWVARDAAADLQQLIDESLEELRGLFVSSA